MNTNKSEEVIYQKLIKDNLGAIIRFQSQKLTFDTYLLYCVDNSTIRAFGGTTITYSPLSIFRNWGYKYLNKSSTRELIENKINFNELHDRFIRNIINYWGKVENQKKTTLKYYQTNKLIDLLFKFMPLSDFISKEGRNYIFKNAFVPLDTYSLAHLKKYSSNCQDIRTKASMSFVNTQERYKKYQDEIKRLCGAYPPIVFDIMAQLEINRFELKPKTKKANVLL